jgi:hypothetical protein
VYCGSSPTRSPAQDSTTEILHSAHGCGLSLREWLTCLTKCECTGFELRTSGLLSRHSTTWDTPPAFFLCVEYFRARVSWTICLGWLWTLILLISTSWVARITGVSHPMPGSKPILNSSSNTET